MLGLISVNVKDLETGSKIVFCCIWGLLGLDLLGEGKKLMPMVDYMSISIEVHVMKFGDNYFQMLLFNTCQKSTLIITPIILKVDNNSKDCSKVSFRFET